MGVVGKNKILGGGVTGSMGGGDISRGVAAFP